MSFFCLEQWSVCACVYRGGGGDKVKRGRGIMGNFLNISDYMQHHTCTTLVLQYHKHHKHHKHHTRVIRLCMPLCACHYNALFVMTSLLCPNVMKNKRMYLTHFIFNRLVLTFVHRDKVTRPQGLDNKLNVMKNKRITLTYFIFNRLIVVTSVHRDKVMTS